MSIELRTHDRLDEQVRIRFQPTIRYVTDFLTASHPSRKGSVCPFVRPALDTGTCLFSVVRRGSFWHILAAVEKVLIEVKRLQNSSCEIEAVVLLFNSEISHSVLDRIHRRLMLKSMEMGFMLGMCGPRVDTPSLHNQNFFPFRAPQNIIVIRDLIPLDVHFFPSSRIRRRSLRRQMYSAYIKKFQHHEDPTVEVLVRDAKAAVEKIKARRLW